jgi:hypothetical protein
MWRKILREIVILNLCLAIFPLTVIILMSVYRGGLNFADALWPWGLRAAEWTSPREGLAIALAVLEVVPYLVVQCIRGFIWSQRSITGRKWVHLYFAVLLSIAATWSFWGAWDFFYFMYALGDLPAELGQFVELEGNSILIFVASVLLGIRCFGIFLDPARRSPQQPGS